MCVPMSNSQCVHRPPAATQNLVIAQGEGVVGAAGFIGIVDGLAPPQLSPSGHIRMLNDAHHAVEIC